MSLTNESHNQMVEDILYLESLINAEQKNIKESLNTRLQGKQNDKEKLDAICDELSFTLAQVTARLSIVEKSLVSGNQISREQAGSLQENTKSLAAKSQMCDEIKLSIEDIGRENYLGYIQHASDNQPYHALSPSSSVTFTLPINRASKKTLAVNIAGVSDHALLKQMVVKVDGVTLKHKVATINGQLRLLSHIPPSKNLTSKTHVELVVPANAGSEQFKLFLSDVHCVPKLSLVSAVKKTLGLAN